MYEKNRGHPEPLRPVLPRPLHPRGPGWTTMLAVWGVVFLVVWLLVRPEQPSPLHDPKAEARAVEPRGDLTSDEVSTIRVFREVSPSVVYITSTQLGRTLFGANIFEIPSGTGSGFVYDRNGHIVTNFHVIQEGSRWRITLADHSEWDARVVGLEPDKDIAVLKIEAPPEQLRPITIGSSGDLQVGQKVLAIGNPFGFDQTLTTGIVSALGREIEAVTGRKIRDVIQTDAAINPGNSGGPLLDSAGRVIGVNTQIASPSGASAGIGFAVPVDIVNEIVPDLIRHGRVLRPGLGVILFEEWRTRGLMERLGVRGLLIDTVTENGGAEEAGLRGTIADRRGYIERLGDIITQVDGRDVHTINGLRDVLETLKVGDEIPVTFVRDERPRTVTVKLQYIN